MSDDNTAPAEQSDDPARRLALEMDRALRETLIARGLLRPTAESRPIDLPPRLHIVRHGSPPPKRCASGPFRPKESTR